MCAWLELRKLGSKAAYFQAELCEMWHSTRFRKKHPVAARGSELKSIHAHDDHVSIQHVCHGSTC